VALFTNGDDEKQAVVIGAAVALHALLAGRDDNRGFSHKNMVEEAFDISREFWKQAKQEVGS